MLNKKVCVIGLGYIGLPTSALLASKNFIVNGFDINQKVIEDIKNLRINNKEPKLKRIVEKTLDKNFHLFSEIKPSDIYIICVPTPVITNHNKIKPDISMVMESIDKIIYFLKPKDTIIIESTCPPGTTKKIKRKIDKSLKFNNYINIAYCPERILPGNIMYELINNDRIIGGINKKSNNIVKKFYSHFCKGKIFTCNETTAEIIKVAENSYRDLNIAFANSLSLICEKEEQNVDEIIKLANHHPRVNILQPGIGVGGHCIPVDPWFLIDKYPRFTKQVLEARKINNFKTEYVFKKLVNLISKFKLNSKKSPKILCLGLSYKENSDDIRESPANNIFIKLKTKFKKVESFDPNIDTQLSKSEIYDLIMNSDILIKLVNHREFNVDPLKSLINTKKKLNY